MAGLIKLTQGKQAIVDDNDFEWLSQWKWQYNLHGYAVRSEGDWRKKSRKTIFMHREIVKTPVGLQTDHINRDKLDNRKVNLRVCTRSQNFQNRLLKNNKSGLKGVYFRSKGNWKRWAAEIGFNNKNYFLGYFKNKVDAAREYNKKAQEFYGKFALINQWV